MRNLILIFILAFFVVSCKNNKAKKQQDSPIIVNNSDSTSVKLQRDSQLLSLTNKVLTAIKTKNYDSLLEYIHPDAGLRLSPYAFVDTASDIMFTAAAFKKETAAIKQRKITWGEFDGTGDPIVMTIDTYFNEFVYDVDFLAPEKRKVNELIGSGNTQSNLAEIYKEHDFTESYFSGFDNKLEGMDWRSLRLIFKQKNGKYYLTGIIHDEWTT